ncbi:hypothetical protein XYCOK13_24970 [Xylanibacillus composti]|uniref:DUF3993 domain-containing protein n=1 Tax=Xylanibacillus composti TaxID=1572762 RepID=A0A8J4H2C7_9BACL|nr:hypothetical protein [Xylanibacillus composti]GIQ69673.1 hypothetical protein XYCOK13_24970 [Xylanibacillus composti]
MKKLLITVLLILFGISGTGCNGDVPDDTIAMKEALNQIPVPAMSSSILHGSESEQLQWLADIYEFEINTLRSKASEITEDERELVAEHLSQVYGSEEVGLLLHEIYQYSQEDQSYFVKDGHWFSYNERWPSSNIEISDYSESSATLHLTGVDDYGGDEREIHYTFSIQDGQMLLEKRTVIK